MAEYTHLVGAEQVQRAASQMQSAADSIRQSVGHLDEILRRHRVEMEALVSRFESVFERAADEDPAG